MSRYRFFGSRISKIALVLDYNLSEVTYWPPNDLWEVKNFKVTIFASWVSRYTFFGSRISRIKLFMDNNLLEDTY